MQERSRCSPSEVASSRREPFPRAVLPMLASTGREPFADSGWLFEPKLDGIRAVALVTRGKARLLSRNSIEITGQYPGLAAELAMLPCASAVLDGEIVALDEGGRPSFQRLQQRMNLTRADDILLAERRIPVFYYAFDLLYLDGYDLAASPLEQRKVLLACVLPVGGQVRLVEHVVGDGVAAFEASVRLGFEGLIAKRRGSPYQHGKRSSFWLKIKATQTGDFVVGGYTYGAGKREGSLGALILGYFDSEGRLIYSGHVGSGFDEDTLRRLQSRLLAIRLDASPFATRPRVNAPAVWVRPELVVEVRFAEFTNEGQLRAPVFFRLRPDLLATAIRRPKARVTGEVLGVPQPAVTGQPEPTLDEHDVNEVIGQLESSRQSTVIRVGVWTIALNNLDKELWPALDDRPAFTKRDLMTYLCKVAVHLLPHLRDRPLTLIRYPHGVKGPHFYQKRVDNDDLPDFVATVMVYSEQSGGDQRYLLCNNLPTLIWLAQLADLELHAWLARTTGGLDCGPLSTPFTGRRANVEASVLNFPDFLLFDLDPYVYSGLELRGQEPELTRIGFAKCRSVAMWLKEILDALSLAAYLKTSGATGLHIYVPILRQFDYDAVRSIAETIAKFLLREHPDDVTTEWAVEKRTGKVFLDYNQNARGKSLAVPYSPRALSQATVSMPLLWEQLEESFPTDFTLGSVPHLLAEQGDPWANILRAKNDLSALL